MISELIIIKELFFSNAITSKICAINEIKFLLFELNYNYKKGTLGVLEGKEIVNIFKYAMKKRMPVVGIISSGGMRIHDGTLALLQMVKIINIIEKYKENGLVYISVLKSVVLGGTSICLVSPANIIISEKSVIYGFSGQKIIKKSFGNNLPNDFQTAQYNEKYGKIDFIIDHEEINSYIYKLLKMHHKGKKYGK